MLTKIIREIPFPIPLEVIFSPTHMTKAVPAVNTAMDRIIDHAVGNASENTERRL